MGAQIGRLHCQSGQVQHRALIGASIGALVATSLVFSTQPGGAVVNVPFGQQPVVTVKDQNGATLTSFTGNVTITIQSGTGTLSGTLVKAAVAGVATFTNLEIDLGGIFELQASIAGAITVVSDEFLTIPGVMRWYNPDSESGADNSTLVAYHDRSGEGDDSTGITGTPLLRVGTANGRNEIEFDGASSFDVPLIGAAPQTVFLVARTSTDAEVKILTSGGGYPAWWIDYFVHDTQFTDAANPASDGTQAFVPRNWTHILCFRNDGVTPAYFRNGTSLTPDTAMSSGKFVAISNIAGVVGFFQIGHQGDLVYCNQALSDALVQQFTAALARKYMGGFRPFLTLLSNSLSSTFATDYAGTWYSQLNVLRGGIDTDPGRGPGVDYYSRSSAGVTTSQLLSSFTSREVERLIDVVRPISAVFVWEGVNDIVVNALTGAQAYDNLVDLCELAKLSGAFTMVGTLTNVAEPPTLTQINACNALFRADFTVDTSNPYIFLPGPGVTYADMLVDLYAQPTLNAFAGHFTAVENAIIAGLMQDALEIAAAL